MLNIRKWMSASMRVVGACRNHILTRLGWNQGFPVDLPLFRSSSISSLETRGPRFQLPVKDIGVSQPGGSLGSGANITSQTKRKTKDEQVRRCLQPFH
uniref:Uncharacterized protein n=1 Tax=Candidatus Kentrum sp. SD TaxID=2126332 RepID=A0A451BNW8_9GAMM|nr:MAG: hypothetical protein BECKSD772F_GA0070984_107914 [Candidatus Kentron sp. SD]VFK49205.1 MAG: hypothetical protein BECKSD772E_GA0070983_11643 [Candidatus Kentron sp. SD]VFK80001.1 MAG: hypothetical protein BECKSD772D_GA0070982_107817 [Candidatus Kentron sp. SD]